MKLCAIDQAVLGVSPRLPRIRKRHGRCFELAALGQQQDPTWTLVHGRIHGWIGHAWLVRADEVYDTVLDKFMSVEQYTAQERAVPERTYSLKEAARMICDSGYWGPWHKTQASVNGMVWQRNGMVSQRRRR